MLNEQKNTKSSLKDDWDSTLGWEDYPDLELVDAKIEELCRKKLGLEKKNLEIERHLKDVKAIEQRKHKNLEKTEKTEISSKERKSITIRNDAEVIGLTENVREKKTKKECTEYDFKSIRYKKPIHQSHREYDPIKDFGEKVPYNNNDVNPISKKNNIIEFIGDYRPQGGQTKADPDTLYKRLLINSKLDEKDPTKKDVYWKLFDEVMSNKSYLPKLFPNEVQKNYIIDKIFNRVYKHFKGPDYHPGGFHVPDYMPSDFAEDQVGDFFVGGQFFKRTANVNMTLRAFNQIANAYDSCMSNFLRTGTSSFVRSENELPQTLLKCPIGIDTIIKSMDNDTKGYLLANAGNICHNNYYVNRDFSGVPTTNSEIISIYKDVESCVEKKEIRKANLTYMSGVKDLIVKKESYFDHIKSIIKDKVHESSKLVYLRFETIFNYYKDHASDLPNMYSSENTLDYYFKAKLKDVIENSSFQDLEANLEKLIDSFESCLLTYEKADEMVSDLLKGKPIPIKLASKGLVKQKIKALKKTCSKEFLYKKIERIILSNKVDVTNKDTKKAIMKDYLDRVTFQDISMPLRDFLLKNGKVPILFLNDGETKMAKYVPIELIKAFCKNINLKSAVNAFEKEALEDLKESYNKCLNWLVRPCDLKIISIYDLMTNMTINGIKIFMKESIRSIWVRKRAELKHKGFFKGSNSKLIGRAKTKAREKALKKIEAVKPKWYTELWSSKLSKHNTNATKNREGNNLIKMYGREGDCFRCPVSTHFENKVRTVPFRC